MSSSILIAACGGSSGSDDAAAAITRAANVSVATGLRMTISLSETVGAPTLLFTAGGSFSPKKRQGSMTMNMQVPSAGGSPTPMRVVIADGTIYERLPAELAARIPGGRPWLSMRLSQLGALNQMPGLNGFIKDSLMFDNPAQYLDLLEAAAAGSTSRIGEAMVNGVRTTQYQTAVDISNLPKATPSADRQAAQQIASVLKERLHTTAVPVDVWIDHANLIRRLQASLRGNYSGHPVSIAITENITRYGSQPAPTVPSQASTTSLLSLVQGPQPSAG